MCLLNLLPANAEDTSKSGTENPSVEFRLAVDKSRDGFTEAELPDKKGTIYLAPEVILSNKDIAKVTHSMEKVNELLTNRTITVKLTKGAGERFKTFTSAHLNERVAVLVHGKVIFAPTIRDAISDSIEISGSFTDEEVTEIVKAMSE